jgi:AraC-like DNA-binding protein
VDRAQSYVERVPTPALAARVRTVWVQRTGARPYLQRNLPTGGVELTHGGPGLMSGGTLADLAAEAGYADQAHLSRECLRLTGLTPRDLLGGRSERCGCGHEHSASYLPFLADRARAARTG